MNGNMSVEFKFGPIDHLVYDWVTGKIQKSL